jgi:hypothetical protein
MTTSIKGQEVQLDGDLLRGIATTLTKLNALKDVSAGFEPTVDAEGQRTDSSVRVDMPEMLTIRSLGERVGTLRRRDDGSWYFSAVVAE